MRKKYDTTRYQAERGVLAFVKGDNKFKCLESLERFDDRYVGQGGIYIERIERFRATTIDSY